MSGISSKGGVQFAGLDDLDSGEGLAIFFSQGGDSTCRYRALVKARTDQGLYDMGEFFISPPIVASSPPGRQSRMVAGAICPGAIGWSVGISAVKGIEEIPDEVADVVLSSSRCTGRPGINRVSERYCYSAGTGNVNFQVLAGMKITGIAAIGIGAGGSITVAGGSTVTIPTGVSANLAPEAAISPNSIIAILSSDWVIEYLESA